MAFTGTATITKVADDLVLLEGLSLAAGANGTISLSGGGGDEELPAAFQPSAYSDVDLSESLKVSVHKVATSTAALDLFWDTTTAGLTTITNDDGVNATPNLKIWVRFH